MKSLTNQLPKLFAAITLLLWYVLATSFTSESTGYTTYRVIRQHKEIGKMRLFRQGQANKQFISVHAHIHSKLLLDMFIVSKNEASFKDGVLVHSSVYREINDKVTVNKNTILQGKAYQLTNGEQKTMLNQYPILYNMVLLYVQEPIGVKQVYADYYQQFVAITKIGLHTYKMILPDGAVNTYEYHNNSCRRILVENKLYEVAMELENN